MSENTECRWFFGKPDRPGIYYNGFRVHAKPCDDPTVVDVRDPGNHCNAWWAFICDRCEPLPVKKLTTQTLYMSPIPWAYGSNQVCYVPKWLGPDERVPPNSYKTDQTREVEL